MKDAIQTRWLVRNNGEVLVATIQGDSWMLSTCLGSSKVQVVKNCIVVAKVEGTLEDAKAYVASTYA
jgi:hypothetical protein